MLVNRVWVSLCADMVVMSLGAVFVYVDLGHK
jgi:hypothetical protein